MNWKMKKMYYPLICKTILISIYFIFFNSNSYAVYEKLFDPIIPDKIYIDLNKKNLGIYANQIYEIQKDNNLNIHPRNKKYFSGNISFKKNKKFKKYKIRLRIVGDWKDHTNINSLISSLQIRIQDGNIGGITKFRLYLPETRKNNNEILWSVIHEELGLPTLYRKMVMVNINNNIYRAIFEEVPSKEFLERWSIRESPIIEYDERQIWLDRYYKKINRLGSKIERYKVDNINFIKTNIDTLIAQKSFNIKETEIIKNFNRLNQEVAPHGLVVHNRKFIYDPIYNIHLPLYFDGMVNIDQKNSCEKLNKLKWNDSKSKENTLFESIVREYKIRLLDKSYDVEECFIKNIILKNNFDFKQIIASEIENAILNKNNYFYQYDEEDFQKYNFKFYGYDVKNSKFCIGDNAKLKNCRNLNFDQIRYLFSGKLNLENQNIPFNIGFFNKKKKENTLTNNLLKFDLDKDYNYIAKSFTNNFILINKNHEKKTKLEFELMPESRIIIINSNLINIDISVNSIKSKSISNLEVESRYNQNLLTGCLTLIDSKFKNVKLKSNGTNCEDDINIVRSSGEIDHIEIKNSSYDAIDFDFSNIKINNIKITNSGNDCIDFSFGIYLISEADLNKCKDKAISVGEKSIFLGKNINAQNSEIGIANKDSSDSYIDKISIKNVKNCLDNYKKKKEFELGRVFIVKKQCNINKVKNLNLISKEDFYSKFKDYEKAGI
jgi:hypothetical protein